MIPFKNFTINDKIQDHADYDYMKHIKKINRRFPGVPEFISVAERYVLKPHYASDHKLRKILRHMSLRSDISNYDNDVFIMIKKYMSINNINNINDIRNLFSNSEEIE